MDKKKIDIIDKYSTTETIVGTWIDGKPIYQKVIETTSSINEEWHEIAIINENIRFITHLEGWVSFRESKDNEFFPLIYNDGITYSNLMFNIARHSISNKTNYSDIQGKPVTLIVEYTKK